MHKTKRPTKRLLCGLLLPISLGLMWLAHRHPAATDRIYSRGIYRALTETYGRLFGILPFSISQFLIILIPLGFGLYALWEIATIIYAATKAPLRKNLKTKALRLAANTLCLAGIIALLFTLGAGINYGRKPLAYHLGLEIRPSYVAELAALTEILVDQANALATQVNRTPEGTMITSAATTIALSQEARDIFRNAGETIPALQGFVPHVKPIIYSPFMSRLRIMGIYSPFTMEAHVNSHVMPYHIPATMIHELAHFRGFMREDEANFIAWLVSHHSGNIDFMYSGALLALTYTANQLHRVNTYEHTRIMSTLHPYIWTDFAANRAYWQQFEGPLAEISRATNDAYLRANRQEDGVFSYGRVVDLLLAYFR